MFSSRALYEIRTYRGISDVLLGAKDYVGSFWDANFNGHVKVASMQNSESQAISTQCRYVCLNAQSIMLKCMVLCRQLQSCAPWWHQPMRKVWNLQSLDIVKVQHWYRQWVRVLARVTCSIYFPESASEYWWPGLFRWSSLTWGNLWIVVSWAACTTQQNCISYVLLVPKHSREVYFGCRKFRCGIASPTIVQYLSLCCCLACICLHSKIDSNFIVPILLPLFSLQNEGMKVNILWHCIQ